MNDSLLTTAKQIGSAIIDTSQVSSLLMQPWAEAEPKPIRFDAHEWVGFKSLDSEPVQIVTDLVALSSDDVAPKLRLWIIASDVDERGIERFNNIQLSFEVSESVAASVTRKGGGTTRDDLREVLDAEDTQLEQIVVSDESGMDQQTEERFGERYFITIGTETDVNREAVEAALRRVALHLGVTTA